MQTSIVLTLDEGTAVRTFGRGHLKKRNKLRPFAVRNAVTVARLHNLGCCVPT